MIWPSLITEVLFESDERRMARSCSRSVKRLVLSSCALILASCGPKVDISPTGDVVTARKNLELALVEGPVRAQIFGDPYGLEPGRQERLVTGAFSDGVQGIKARFTADPGLFAATQPRLVVVLNPQLDPPSAEACRAPERIRTGPASGSLTVLAAFCEGDQLINGARANGDIDGPSDQRLNRLLWQTAGVLFPDNYKNEYGLDLIPGVNIGLGGSFGF
ncbi:MAG: hypothetical protein ACR2QJ_15475 [Geminicoccaceae bacterium]